MLAATHQSVCGVVSNDEGSMLHGDRRKRCAEEAVQTLSVAQAACRASPAVSLEAAYAALKHHIMMLLLSP